MNLVKDYSQFGEQYMLLDVFDKIKFKHLKSVEFGAGNGYALSNTRHFIEQWDFTGVLWDIDPKSKEVNLEKVMPSNINELFEKYELIGGCDLMSMDIDGNDYWVWKELKYNPRVVIVEFNRFLPKGMLLTIPYDKNHRFDETIYYGASWDALLELGQSKGYTLVKNNNTNMIFVLNEEMDDELVPKNKLDYEIKQDWGTDKLNRKWYNIKEGTNICLK